MICIAFSLYQQLLLRTLLATHWQASRHCSLADIQLIFDGVAGTESLVEIILDLY